MKSAEYFFCFVQQNNQLWTNGMKIRVSEVERRVIVLNEYTSTNSNWKYLILSFRPIAGNINICPKRLRGDHNSLDFDRLVSTIKHEILHTLVIKTLHCKNN
jgi:hypothetical protein